MRFWQGPDTLYVRITKALKNIILRPIKPCMPLHIREQYVKGFLRHNFVCRSIRYKYRRLRIWYWKKRGYYSSLPESMKKIED